MYKITEKVALNPTVTKMVIEAPLIAKKAKPGQFIIVRPFEDSERIPLTVAGYDREKGTVDIIFQIVGGTTMELNSLNAGDCVHDFVGPLGRATETEGLKKVCVVGGGVGCAIALPIAKELHDQGCVVHSVVGFRNKDLLILEDEFNACSDELRIMTDDGSYGTKGVVTAALDELVAAGNQYDLVITIGPLIMMKFVVKTCQKHGLKSIVSMNPIMIDGTGMCGGCRLTVGGQTKFLFGFGDVDHFKDGVLAEELALVDDEFGGGVGVVGVVDADADAHGACGDLVANEQKRTLREADHLGGDAAHEEAFHGGEAAAAHDDEVGVHVVGLADDDGRELAALDLGADVKVAGVFAHGVDDLHAFVLAGLADGIEAERVDHGFGDGVLNIEKLNGRLLFRRERLAGGNEAECVAAVFAAVDGKKNAHEGYLLFV